MLRILLPISFLIFIVSVFYVAMTTPITPHEAKIFYTFDNVLSKIMHLGNLFIGGIFGSRVLFVLVGILTVVAFYMVQLQYFTNKNDAALSTILFMLLPGVLTATSLVNISILVLPIVLLFILLYNRNSFWPLPILMGLLFYLHEASIIFFIAVALFSFSKKDLKLSVLSVSFLILFIYFSNGIAINGRPNGYFIDIFGLYATIFSPLVFLYFFYSMYRIFLKEDKNLIWYIAFTALLISLLLSLRQKIYITDFAPYMLIAIGLMLSTFNKSIRVKLPDHRLHYKFMFMLLFVSLVFSSIMIVFHKQVYYTWGFKDKHFAKKVYQPYDKYLKLKEQGLNCYDTNNLREYYQLKFYKLESCTK